MANVGAFAREDGSGNLTIHAEFKQRVEAIIVFRIIGKYQRGPVRLDAHQRKGRARCLDLVDGRTTVGQVAVDSVHVGGIIVFHAGEYQALWVDQPVDRVGAARLESPPEA